MNIVYKTPDELTPYENNPRNNDEAVAAVASSIRQFGWNDILSMSLTATAIEVIIALCDTPFLYWAKK